MKPFIVFFIFSCIFPLWGVKITFFINQMPLDTGRNYVYLSRSGSPAADSTEFLFAMPAKATGNLVQTKVITADSLSIGLLGVFSPDNKEMQGFEVLPSLKQAYNEIRQHCNYLILCTDLSEEAAALLTRTLTLNKIVSFDYKTVQGTSKIVGGGKKIIKAEIIMENNLLRERWQ